MTPGPARVAPVRSALRGLLYLALPPLCPLCQGASPAPGRPFCQDCGAGLTPLGQPWCTSCSVPFAGRGPCHPCPRCRRDPPPFERAVAWGSYAGPLAQAIQRFKYAGQLTLRRALQDLAVDVWRHHYSGLPFTAVVPVPPHPETLRRRGCDLAALLSRAVARAAGASWRAQGLRKMARTPELVTLDARSRQAAVTGVYGPGRPMEGTVLLVDDVITTTATLRACAAACRAGGAAQVWGLALARTPATGRDN